MFSTLCEAAAAQKLWASDMRQAGGALPTIDDLLQSSGSYSSQIVGQTHNTVLDKPQRSSEEIRVHYYYYYCFLILGTVALKQINSDSTFCYSLLGQWPLPPICPTYGG